MFNLNYKLINNLLFQLWLSIVLIEFHFYKICIVFQLLIPLQ